MKKYQIGNYAYDHTTGKITSTSGKTSSTDSASILRAKSNDVLRYFLQHPGQLLSKQQILDEVWDDVAAQEHVLFQSIKEIRQCFAGKDVIKTHPRKGYEWIAPADEQSTASNQDENHGPVATNKKNRPAITYVTYITIAVFFISVVFLFTHRLSTERQSNDENASASPSKPRFVELVITPVNIRNQQDNLTQWVPIGAMDMLIKKLQQTNFDRETGGIVVVDTEDVLEALKRADARNTKDHELQSRQLRHNMGEITSLHTELYGSPMEYSLKYKLINRDEIRQGLLSGDTVVQLVNKLARQLPDLLQMKTTEPFVAYQRRFANDAFIFGLSHYYEYDFAKAADYFRTAIAAGDDFPQSRRYLANSIAAQGQAEDAIKLAQDAVSYARATNNAEEELRSLFELGVNQWRLGDFQQAKENIERTQTLAKQGKDLLYLAFSIEMLGHFALANEQYSDARHYYLQALDYHQGFQCPYGRTANNINLSNVAMRQGDVAQGNAFLDSALSIARQNELIYFETRIHLLMARESLTQNRPESVGLHLDYAQTLVDKYPNKGAEEILLGWPESAKKIR